MKSNLILRLLTALVGIPALVWIVAYGGPRVFSWFIFIAALICLWEYYTIAFPPRRSAQLMGILAGLAAAVGVLMERPSAWLAGATVLLFSSCIFSDGKLEERFNRLGWTLVGTIYIGTLLPHAALVYRLPDGPQWIFFTLIVVMVGDSAAYFTGRAIGRRKLYPEVSPGKTVEGAIGGTAASLAAGVAAGIYFLPSRPWPELAAVALVLSVLGQIGDLFESWIKRVFGAKDASAILPGHGGLLDRMDSLIFPLVFIAYYARFFPR